MACAPRKVSPRDHRPVPVGSGWPRRGAPGRGILCVLLGLLIATGLASAAPSPFPLGSGDPREAVEKELDATDRIIERARDQVAEGVGALRASVTTQAQALLQAAVRLQRDARGHYYAGTPGGLRKARDFTLSARQQAIRAIELSQVEYKAHENLKTLLEQTREMVLETREIVQRTGDAEAAHLLRSGEDRLRRAEEAYRDRKFRPAIRLAVVARDLLRRSQDTARGTGPGGVEATETSLERTDALLREVGEAIREQPSSDDIESLHNGATELQSRARQAFRNGRLPRANLLTRMARERALSVLVRIQASPSKEDLEAGLDLLDDLYADLRGVAEESRDSQALKFLEQGRDHLVKARRALDSGKTGEALREARAAEALLRRISDRLPEL